MEALTARIDSFNKTIRTDPMASIMNDPVKKSKFTPELLRCMQIAGISYFLSSSLIMLLSSLIISMPIIYEDSATYWARTLFSVYALFQVMLNFFFVATKRSFYDEHSPAFFQVGIPDPSWVMCIDCKHHIPPRAHHCGLCRKCVLRRDHHCFFTGCCVGFENQRYFVVFCFYCTIGAAYATYVTVEYIYMVHMNPDSGLAHFFIPLTLFEWIFGYATFGFLFFVIQMYLCAMTAMGSAGIMVWQLFLVSQGSTSFEYGKGVISYNMNFLHNIRSVFGPYWLLNFIIPMPWLKTPGNGVDWNVSKYV